MIQVSRGAFRTVLLIGRYAAKMPRVDVTGDMLADNRAGFDHKASSCGYHAGELVAIDYHGNVYRGAA